MMSVRSNGGFEYIETKDGVEARNTPGYDIKLGDRMWKWVSKELEEAEKRGYEEGYEKGYDYAASTE